MRLMTLTGVDASTDPVELRKISEQYRFAEFGVLFSKSKQGTTPRYPDQSFVIEFLRSNNSPAKRAIHFCGESVLVYINLPEIYSSVIQFGTRVQLNFNLSSVPIDFFRLERASKFRDTIIQYNSGNRSILRGDSAPFYYLFDSSGGKGSFTFEQDGRVSLPRPFNSKMHGYAGGLSAQNIESILEEANKINEGPYWVDMESSVRTDDRFDLKKCVEVLEIGSKYWRPTK